MAGYHNVKASLGVAQTLTFEAIFNNVGLETARYHWSNVWPTISSRVDSYGFGNAGDDACFFYFRCQSRPPAKSVARRPGAPFRLVSPLDWRARTDASWPRSLQRGGYSRDTTRLLGTRTRPEFQRS